MIKSKAIKAGIGYTIGNYFLKGLTFFSIPIFARLLDPSDYGIVNTFNAYESITWLFVGFCLHSCLKRAKVKFEKDFNQFLSFCVFIVLLNTIIWLIASWGFSNYIAKTMQITTGLLILLVLQSSASALIQIFNSHAALFYNYYSFLSLAGINTILNIGLSIWLIISVFNNNRAIGRIIGNATPSILISVFICFYFFNKSKPIFRKEYFQFCVLYCLPIIPHGVSQIILSQFDRIMITSMIGPLQSGLYSFAYNIYSIIMVTVNSLETVWSTWFFEQMTLDKQEKIRQKANDFALGILIFCSIILLISPEIIKIIGTEKYKDSIYSVIPIVVGGYFAFLYYLPASVEYFFEKTKYIAIASACAALLNIILNYVFIKQFGYISAAYTTMITYIFYFLFHYYVSYKIIGKCIFDSKALMSFGLIIIIIGFLSITLLANIVIRFGFATSIIIYAAFLVKNYFSANNTKHS